MSHSPQMQLIQIWTHCIFCENHFYSLCSLPVVLKSLSISEKSLESDAWSPQLAGHITFPEINGSLGDLSLSLPLDTPLLAVVSTRSSPSIYSRCGLYFYNKPLTDPLGITQLVLWFFFFLNPGEMSFLTFHSYDMFWELLCVFDVTTTISGA